MQFSLFGFNKSQPKVVSHYDNYSDIYTNDADNYKLQIWIATLIAGSKLPYPLFTQEIKTQTNKQCANLPNYAQLPVSDQPQRASQYLKHASKVWTLFCDLREAI